ncbi:MAG: hypothetical protein HUK24_07270 [Sphaerochaetaceae bacterium]|nr:hypothetical protein [Sphaerochaetaceae bacterium]
MNKTSLKTKCIAFVLLISIVGLNFVSCNGDYKPLYKDSISFSSMKNVMSKSIDVQLEYVKDFLDEDLQLAIENGTDGNGVSKSGSEIVSLTLEETNGRDYLDFCYTINITEADSIEAAMETAKYVLSTEDYNSLWEEVESKKEEMWEDGISVSKGIPLDQQEAFFKDLKTLITRTTVLMVAGVVYACVPELVFWGKVSAAAAVSIAAGSLASVLMTIYQNYRWPTTDNKELTFDQWLDEVTKIPKADYALSATAVALGTSLNKGPVVTGIIICVFGLYNVWNMVNSIVNKYNFDA